MDEILLYYRIMKEVVCWVLVTLRKIVWLWTVAWLVYENMWINNHKRVSFSDNYSTLCLSGSVGIPIISPNYSRCAAPVLELLFNFFHKNKFLLSRAKALYGMIPNRLWAHAGISQCGWKQRNVSIRAKIRADRQRQLRELPLKPTWHRWRKTLR